MEEKITVTKKDIVEGLKSLGIKNGDSVLVHSSLSKFGYVEGGIDAVIDALLSTVGKEGTILVPTLTGNKDLCAKNPPVFDPVNTPCWTGKIPETFRKRKEAVRSLHPTHSVSAIGKLADYFVKGHEDSLTPCGKNSPYWKLAEKGGYILFLGVSINCCTFLHSIEEIAKAPYHLQKEIVKAKIIVDGKEIYRELYIHAYGTAMEFARILPVLEKNNALRRGKIGNSDILLVKAKNIADFILPIIENDKLFLVKAK